MPRHSQPSTASWPNIFTGISRGDHDAFTAFYHQTARQVYGLTRRIIVDTEMAKEATQDIYLIVWQEAHRYNQTLGTPTAWLMTIAHRRTVDKVRAEQSSTNRAAHWATHNHTPDYDTVAETVATKIEAQTVITCLKGLSPHPARSNQSCLLPVHDLPASLRTPLHPAINNQNQNPRRTEKPPNLPRGTPTRMIITTYEQDRAARIPDQHIADLESARPLLVRTILGALTACTNDNSTCDLNASLSTSRQRLISAAISDLEDLDNQIHAARNPDCS
ncbi:sigma factor [Arthrobacter sp. CAL618]|uniref:sigma factor n=1 Tax=Arthrobacter sp. CAL618 TaxID=1055770 RepID=UPI0012EB8CFA|nr:sigma factor [Arthrobacter sp. CAL618]